MSAFVWPERFDPLEPELDALGGSLEMFPCDLMDNVELNCSPVHLPQSPVAETPAPVFSQSKPILIPQSPQRHAPHPLNLHFSPEANPRFVHVVTSTIVKIDPRGQQMEPVFTETVFMQELGKDEPAVFTELRGDGVHVRTGPNPRLLKALEMACL